MATSSAVGGKALYLVAYDITHPKRLGKVHRFVKGYRTGGQKSVHECFLSSSELKFLSIKLARLMKAKEDRLLVYKVMDGNPIFPLGRAIPPKDALFWYFGD